MGKKLLFCLTVLMMLSTSCRHEFSAERIKGLTALHKSPAEYSKSEIKDIELQLDLYTNYFLGMVDDALNETDRIQRKRKLAKIIAWYKSDELLFDKAGKLLIILKDSPHTDHEKYESILQRILEITYALQIAGYEC